MGNDQLTKEKLEEIRERWNGKTEANYDDAVRDVQSLVQEIERLRGAAVS